MLLTPPAAACTSTTSPGWSWVSSMLQMVSRTSLVAKSCGFLHADIDRHCGYTRARHHHMRGIATKTVSAKPCYLQPDRSPLRPLLLPCLKHHNLWRKAVWGLIIEPVSGHNICEIDTWMAHLDQHLAGTRPGRFWFFNWKTGAQHQILSIPIASSSSRLGKTTLWLADSKDKAKEMSWLSDQWSSKLP